MNKLLIFILSFLVSERSPVIKQKQVPILCYHQIRNWKAKDRQADKAYIIPPAAFEAQMKMLADSGYHAILPDELYDHLTLGKALPAKPVILTFDDTNADQFTAARPVLLKYHFKAVYFIITGKIGTHKWFLDARQIKQLSDEGNVIGCHTLSHTDLRKLRPADRQAELGQPKKQLEEITGRPVNYFAFPFGYWDQAGLPILHELGFKAAFQLDDELDKRYPLMTIRRLIVPGYWTPQALDQHLKSFNARQ